MNKLLTSNTNLEILIDEKNYERLSKYSWYQEEHSGNVRRCYWEAGKTVNVSIAREILDVTSIVDHIDNNPLNNLESNLRVVTQQQNSMNASKRRNASSQYKGVSWSNSHNKWIAGIMFNRKQKYLGQFNCEEDAALAYNDASTKYFGEFAKLNNVQAKKGNKQ